MRNERRLTYQKKSDLVKKYFKLKHSDGKMDQKSFSAMHSVPQATFSRWLRNPNVLSTGSAVKRRKFTRSIRGVGIGVNVEAENMLYGRFVWRVKHLRKKVTSAWLQRQMRLIYRDNGQFDKSFKASYGWVTGFRKRYCIVDNAVTNKHKQSLISRLPLIQKFHRWLIYDLQRSMPCRCPKYGRFPPSLMWHMDQSPLPFSANQRRSLNVQGHALSISEGHSGASKRFCTLQITICADPTLLNLVNIEIIFRGQGTRLSERELDLYSTLPNVTIRFQRRAWADERIMQDYLINFRHTLASAGFGEVLLGMDNHGAQQTPWCRAFMEHFHIVPAFTPANCTDCVSPVDHL